MQNIRLVYELFVKYFTLLNSSLLNGQLSVRKVEHRLHRNCAEHTHRGKNCVIEEKWQNCGKIALCKIAEFWGTT